MSYSGFKFRRDLRALNRRAREWRMILRGTASTDHPVMAHIIPIRRCNLSCTYCNEYDDFSKPVAVATMTERLDQLGRSGHDDCDLQRRRASAASGSRPAHRARAQARHDRGNDHQRLSADTAARESIERRRAGPHADQHRQRHAGRSVEEEPEGAGQEAADPGRVRFVPREYQLGVGRRHSQSRRRAGGGEARAGTGVHIHGRESFTIPAANCGPSASASARCFWR